MDEALREINHGVSVKKASKVMGKRFASGVKGLGTYMYTC